MPTTRYGAPTGFEGSVAAAVAAELGYTANQVGWERIPDFEPDNPVADVWIDRLDRPGPGYDLTAPYYRVPQAVVVRRTGPAVDGLADLSTRKLGTVGTHRAAGLPAPTRFGTVAAATAALTAGRVDALVLDLPTALATTRDRGLAVAGQLPATGGARTFRMAVPAGSPVTRCIDQALSTLARDGTLARLERQWLTARVLR